MFRAVEKTWRDRLTEALDGRSMRSLSLDAGLSAGYVHGILKDGKDPTVDNITAVCRALQVSPLKVLYGLEMTPEMEDVFRLWSDAPEAIRHSILQILRAHKAVESPPEQTPPARVSSRAKPQRVRA